MITLGAVLMSLARISGWQLRLRMREGPALDGMSGVGSGV